MSTTTDEDLSRRLHLTRLQKEVNELQRQLRAHKYESVFTLLLTHEARFSEEETALADRIYRFLDSDRRTISSIVTTIANMLLSRREEPCGSR